MLDRQIEKTVHDTEGVREQTRVLQAEWTLLNDPERLRQFADQYLNLKSMQPSQFAGLPDLDQRLPAPRAEAPPTPPVVANAPIAVPSQGIPGVSDASAADTGDVVADDTIPLPPVPPPPPAAASPVVALAAPPIRLADPKPVPPRAPARQVADVVPAHPPVVADLRPAVHPTEVRPTEVRPPEARPVEPHPLEPRMAAVRPPIQAVAAPPAPRAYAPPSQPMTGSLLGMAQGGAPAPMPVPIPRPMPVNAQWANGN